jgi:hypothetical protein
MENYIPIPSLQLKLIQEKSKKLNVQKIVTMMADGNLKNNLENLKLIRIKNDLINQGQRGNQFMKKNLKRKILWHCPFK